MLIIVSRIHMLILHLLFVLMCISSFEMSCFATPRIMDPCQNGFQFYFLIDTLFSRKSLVKSVSEIIVTRYSPYAKKKVF